MTNDSLAARAERALNELPAIGIDERFEAQGTVPVVDRSIPDKYYANHLEQVTA